MIKLQLDQHSTLPLYEQIADQLKQLIAKGQLKQGDRLPTIRKLAKDLCVNANTVVRSYKALEQEQVIVSHRGGGTSVATITNDPTIQIIRHRLLSNVVSTDILKLLSMSYSPEEIEATFDLHLSRWRAEVPEREAGETGDRDTINIVGSNDMALNLLVDRFRKKYNRAKVNISSAGSLGGLIALQEERADAAGIHLLDEETGKYNYPYVKRILPGQEIAIVNLTYRIQSLIFMAGNPKRIKGLDDLRRKDVRFVNRQKGSGTKVLLDLKLRQSGISPSEISGYENELDTHQAVALSILNGEADVSLGIEAAARIYNLGSLPLYRERYDLVIPKEKYTAEPVSSLIKMIESRSFKEEVNKLDGYDTSETGDVSFID
jgi:molybdate-binding protein/DNA-binding transcriptional regulator YhcF (GntR family)